MNDEQDKILAALAAGYQKISDRQDAVEEIFGKSLIIPGEKINAFLLVLAFMFFFVCFTFGFIWYLDRPI